MEANRGERTANLVRTVLLTLATLVVALVAAAAVAPQADAHQTAGRTLIYIDGDLVKSTTDDHFTFTKRLAPGCHKVEVAQRRGGEVVSRSVRRYCSEEPTRLIVEVDDGSVSSTTRTIDSA